jgi:CRP/FNR family transcriptional regulator
LSAVSGGAAALLFAYPRSDSLFRQLVAGLVRGVRVDDIELRTARRHLRGRYPNADLNRQREVLVRDVPTETWFAYRDGRTRPLLPDQLWWDQRGAARGVVDGTGRITRSNAPLRTLLHVDAPGRDLLTTGEFVSDDLARDLTSPSADVRGLRGLASTAVVRRRSGRNVDVEFHLAYDEAGPGRHGLAVRSYADRDGANEREAVAGSSLVLLSPSLQRELLRSVTRRDLAAGERLAESVVGNPWTALVVAGIVRLYLSSDGVEPTLQYAGHGRLVGTQAVGEGTMAVGLQTVTPSRLLLFNPTRIVELIGAEPRFAHAVGDDGAEMLRSVVASYAAHSSATLEQRLARELLLLQGMQPGDTLIAVTEQQLADGVGSIRESVGRTIASFRHRGWVATTRNGVIVLDPDGLRSVVEARH